VQSLIRDALLRHGKTFFDYGCGRGDDVATLQANGFDATGWDPYYSPDGERRAAHIVNLGFVINVIEDRAERIEALEVAFALTDDVLAVATMLAVARASDAGRSYRDGIVTRRNTFQKFYGQAELQQFIESVLDQDAYPAAPGVFYVFKNRLIEQSYLLGKCSDRSRAARARLNFLVPVRERQKGTPARIRTDRSAPVTSHEGVGYLDLLWNKCLELGRTPICDEFPDVDQAQHLFGSTKRALTTCLSLNDAQALTRAAYSRQNDILVMLALQFFGQRRRFTQLEPQLQNDVKEFFGSFNAAEVKARHLLFSVQDTDTIRQACDEAAALGLGWLETGHSLQLHTSLVERLPAALRVYLGCATALAGSMGSFDLVKAHIESGKVSLMAFDDFTNKPLPALMSRIKVRLRDQDLDIFDYKDPYLPPLLYNKSRYINEEFPRYAEQVAFEEALEALGLFDLSGYGPEEKEFHRLLGLARKEVVGFDVRPSTRIPGLDEPCGATFTYRQLIECGQTWARTRVTNVPASANTYNALHELATTILDPVVEYFGSVELTYGFASSALTRLISKNIAPKVDQHASCETNRRGGLISPRLGAAIDFFVEYEDMVGVAKWVAANCRFDRMYVYGVDRPLHVSVGPEQARQVYEIQTVAGKRIPKRLVL
jgi:DNA phosphorothioation-associated putative methyltransferase